MIGMIFYQNLQYKGADYTKVDEAIAKANVLKKEKPASTKLGTSDKSLKTGDTSNLALWIVLLFVSGGAAIGQRLSVERKSTTDNGIAFLCSIFRAINSVDSGDKM